MTKKKNKKNERNRKLREAKKRFAKNPRPSLFALKNKGKQAGITLSYCSIHGPYTSDRLCDCYDEEGKIDGVSYEDKVLEDAIYSKKLTRQGVCPIHGGPFAISENDVIQCGCFDNDGNKIKNNDEMIH